MRTSDNRNSLHNSAPQKPHLKPLNEVPQYPWYNRFLDVGNLGECAPVFSKQIRRVFRRRYRQEGRRSLHTSPSPTKQMAAIHKNTLLWSPHFSPRVVAILRVGILSPSLSPNIQHVIIVIDTIVADG